MEETQSIEDFYRQKLNVRPDNLKKDVGHFNVFRLDDFVGEHCKPIPYSRKDYYKISLIVGENRVHYADKTLAIDEQALFFANPQIPYKWEELDQDQTGFFCVFTKAFFHQFGSLLEYPVFQPDIAPVFPLTDDERDTIAGIYLEMLDVIDSDFTYKEDALRNLVFELVLKAMRLAPVNSKPEAAYDASDRIASLFLELLERQFPIEHPGQTINLRFPSDYANQLSVHVNHLNRALKETAQKTTSTIINERLAQEAKILLKHTDWNISQIGYSLGFEEPTNFSKFFKTNTQLSPSKFRSV